MDINRINAPQQPFGTDPSQFKNRSTNVYNSIAQLFNESPEQLQSELQARGATLSALAQQKGVSETDLESAIKSGLQQTNAGFSETQLSNLASRIAHHKHGHHPHAAVDPEATRQTQQLDATQSGTVL